MAKTREKYTEHPSIVVINNTPRLRVFEDFFIEDDLPKWKKIAIKLDKENTNGDVSSFNVMQTGSITDDRSEEQLLHGAKYERGRYIRREPGGDEALIIRNSDTVKSKRKSWFGRIIEQFSNRSEKGVPVEKVFDDIKSSMVHPTNEELIHAKKLVDTVEDQLRITGQYEIADRVKASRGVLEAEVAIVKGGDLKYVSEEQIVKFMLMSERGMRLEYLRYYANILPAEVAKKKILADALLVFDNYCVLHYSDDAKFSLIKEKIDDDERRRRRDPILFGMIKGSRKLYYITDWITDDDDLTLEKLEKCIGEKAMDVGDTDFLNTREKISKMLNRFSIDVKIDIEKAAKDGNLVTEKNIEDWVKNGVPPNSVRTIAEQISEKKLAKNDKKKDKS